MKTNQPDDFQAACELDEDARLKDPHFFLHPSAFRCVRLISSRSTLCSLNEAALPLALPTASFARTQLESTRRDRRAERQTIIVKR